MSGQAAGAARVGRGATPTGDHGPGRKAHEGRAPEAQRCSSSSSYGRGSGPRGRPGDAMSSAAPGVSCRGASGRGFGEVLGRACRDTESSVEPQGPKKTRLRAGALREDAHADATCQT